MKNSEMIPLRFARWAEYRRRLRWVIDRLKEGRTVYFSTALSRTAITIRHIDRIKATRTGLYILHGKRWIDYSGTHIAAR